MELSKETFRTLHKTINDLLYLEQKLTQAIHEEIANIQRKTLKNGFFISSDIFDRLHYIIDEQANNDSRKIPWEEVEYEDGIWSNCPERDREYLFCDKSGNVFIDELLEDCEGCYLDSGDISTIVAFMELPAPFKKENNE